MSAKRTSKDYPLDEIFIPMGAKEVKDEVKMDALWDDNSYVSEMKYDGVRMVSVGGRFFSRRISVKDGFPVEKTENIPHLASILNRFPLLILDGEVYYEGMSSNEVTSIMGASPDKACRRQSFGDVKVEGDDIYWRMDLFKEWQKLDKSGKEDFSSRKEPLDYVIFDILRDLDGNWLIDLPWKVRRARLLKTYADICMQLGVAILPYISVSEVEAVNKREFYSNILRSGGEGVILKNVEGKYVPDKKPSWNWVKVKKHITDDVVIMGFKPAVREYEGKEITDWKFWESEDGEKVALDGEAHANQLQKETGKAYYPVTKFYFYDWVGAVTFGKFDPTNVVEICDRDGSNCNNYPQLKELGFCSGITDELRETMSKNPESFIGECMEIGAMEVTKDGFYRHPQFSRMRPDKNPSECIVQGE